MSDDKPKAVVFACGGGPIDKEAVSVWDEMDVNNATGADLRRAAAIVSTHDAEAAK